MPLEPRYLRPQDLRARRGAGHGTAGASGGGKAIVVSGEVDIGSLTRLPEPFRPHGQSAGTLDCALRFSAEDARTCRVDGELTFELDAVCQRCLNVFRWQGAGPVDVRVVEQAVDVPVGQLPDDFIVLNGQPLDMLRLAEDELVLSLPMVPVHGHDCLDIHAVTADEDVAGTAQDTRTASPFAVLEALRSGPEEALPATGRAGDQNPFED